jgi:hypothetical protein
MFGIGPNGRVGNPYYPGPFDEQDATPIGGGFSLTPINPAPMRGLNAGQNGPSRVGVPVGDNAGPTTLRLGRTNGMFAAGPRPQLPDIAGQLNQSLVDQTAKADAHTAHRKKVMGDVAGAIAAGLNGYLAAMGNPAGIEGLRSMHEQQMAKQQEAAQLEQLRAKSYLPQQVGDSLIQLDPSGGYQTLFRDPQPFEAYAASLGYQPGTPEYQDAVENYRLGAWSDPAVAAKTALTGYRYDRSDAQLGRRLATTERGQDLTHGDRVRGQDLTHGDRIRGQNLTHGDRQATIRQSDTNSQRTADTQRGAYSYTHGGKRGAGVSDGPIAVGPDGKRYTVKNGQWVPIQ